MLLKSFAITIPWSPDSAGTDFDQIFPLPLLLRNVLLWIQPSFSGRSRFAVWLSAASGSFCPSLAKSLTAVFSYFSM